MSPRLLGMTILRYSTAALSISSLLSPKLAPLLINFGGYKTHSGKGERFSEHVKARFLMSLRLLGMTRKMGSD
ncbi:hypothetical protein BI375_16270 [Vibrio rotiferianus]|jgi:hypothetical protein|uniref:Secreted protein n=1 Tax=Vibrio rotiferianus TaxID=190895 RepID=A0ABX3DCP4_9VIBR|nr:hypothetical protein BI375_16270 [Vibrio rotiferianus]